MANLAWVHGARSIVEMGGDGCYEFYVDPYSAGVVCGLNGADAGTDPNEITHGFFVREGAICVVEQGVQKTAWAAPNIPGLDLGWAILLLRIYRVGGRVTYTMWANEDSFETWPSPPEPSAVASGAVVLGQIVYSSQQRSTGTVFLDSSFGEPHQSISFAALKDVELVTASVYAVTPAWRSRAQDTASNSVYAVTPAWVGVASELAGNRVLARTPAWVGRAGTPAFEVTYNGVYARTPAWRTQDPATKQNPRRTPAWRAKAIGGGAVSAKTPAWHARSGDAISAVHAKTPAWKALAMAPADMTGLAYGEVWIELGLEAHALDSDVFSTEPMVAELGGAMSLRGVFTLPTVPAALWASGTGQPTGASRISTSPMLCAMGGDLSAVLHTRLAAAPMQVSLGGSIEPTSAVMLPTQVFMLLSAGSVGTLSRLNEVFVSRGDGGTTRYLGYEFNSFARIGGKYYGASDDGLFILEGETDMGRPIVATFGLGQLDFGSPQLKTVPYCYIGAAAQAMSLDIEALLNGEPARFTYAARGHGASMREVRFDLGRGLRSSYVMPTFANIGGGGFEVDAVRFLVAESTRRI